MLEAFNTFIINHNTTLASGSSFYPLQLPDMPGIQKDTDMLIIGHQLESYLMKLVMLLCCRTVQSSEPFQL